MRRPRRARAQWSGVGRVPSARNEIRGRGWSLLPGRSKGCLRGDGLGLSEGDGESRRVEESRRRGGEEARGCAAAARGRGLEVGRIGAAILVMGRETVKPESPVWEMESTIRGGFLGDRVFGLETPAVGKGAFARVPARWSRAEWAAGERGGAGRGEKADEVRWAISRLLSGAIAWGRAYDAYYASIAGNMYLSRPYFALRAT